MRATDTDWAGLVLIRARVITHEHSPIEPFKFGASRPDLKPVESMGRFPLAPIGYSSVVSSSAILRWLNFLRREELTAEIWHLFSIRKGFGAFLMTSVLHQSLFQYRAGKHACKKTCGGEVEISFAHFTWKYIFIPALPRKGQWQFCQFSLWVVFSLCNISIYRNIIIHWFRILDFFFLLVNHIYTLHCYGNWGSCKAQGSDEGLHPTFLLQGPDPNHGIVHNTIWIKPKGSAFLGSVKKKKSRFLPDKCIPALSTGIRNWQLSVCRGPTQHFAKSIVRLWPSLLNNRQTPHESLSRGRERPRLRQRKVVQKGFSLLLLK